MHEGNEKMLEYAWEKDELRVAAMLPGGTACLPSLPAILQERRPQYKDKKRCHCHPKPQSML